MTVRGNPSPDRAESCDCQEYFDTVAPAWDVMRQSFYSEAVRDAALSAARIEPGQTALDLGAGTGFITEALLQAGLNVIAVDQSVAMLRELRSKCLIPPHLDCRVGNAEHLPLPDSTVNCVLANMLLHHVEHPAVAIREMARVLRPGGRVVITDLDEHAFEFLRREHQDRWMGFRRPDVTAWFSAAGLGQVSVGDIGQSCCASSNCGTQHAAISIFLATGQK